MSKHNIENKHLVMGCHSLEEVLKHSPQRLIKVFHLPLNNKTQARKSQLIAKLRKLKKEMHECSKGELDQLCGSTSHQGIAAILKEKVGFDVKTFLKEEKTSLIVVLDSIFDPHNVGAILRACECFGVDLVVWSKNRGAQLTPVVTKTSSSATEFVNIQMVANLSTALDQYKEAGFSIIGAQLNETSESLFKFEFPKKSVLILGSEGEGIRPLLKSKLDYSIAIPLFGKIDSLNVSQAAAVCLGFWRSQNL